jgi:hypothetical protein
MVTDLLKELDSNLLNQSNPVNVDPISSIDLQNNIETLIDLSNSLC